MEQLKLIMEYVTGFLGGSTGLAIIGVVVYKVAKAILEHKGKKYAKLDYQDKNEIANDVKAAIKDGVEVDITSELDKATKKLVSEHKAKLNELIAVNNEDRRLLYAVAQTLAQFKTIQGTTALAELQKALDGVKKDEIELVDDDRVVAKVKVEEEKVDEKVDKIRY